MGDVFSFNRWQHGYGFDPTYGYDLVGLEAVRAGEAPADFATFWEARFRQAARVEPQPQLVRQSLVLGSQVVFQLTFASTGGVRVGGWLLLPAGTPPERAMIVTHGYGGRSGPEACPAWGRWAVFLLCLRGFGLSAQAGVPSEAARHVIHGITDPDRYLLGQCVEDVWLAVRALEHCFPQVAGRIGYSGCSFGGGIGALAVPWCLGISRAHFEVPTFGHQRLRLQLPTVGSGAAVQAAHRQRPAAVERTLSYFDAAFSARHFTQPTHWALARFDPAVASPGQWAIYHEAPPPKQRYVLEAGHFDYPEAMRQARELEAEKLAFFGFL